MAVHVTIWHNVNRDGNGMPTGFMRGYHPGDDMCPVFTFARADDKQDILDYCFEVFNAPEEYLKKEDRKLAEKYRANRLRSLSVGDVVQVGDSFWVTRAIGWDYLGQGVSLNVAEDPWSSW